MKYLNAFSVYFLVKILEYMLTFFGNNAIIKYVNNKRGEKMIIQISDNWAYCSDTNKVIKLK